MHITILNCSDIMPHLSSIICTKMEKQYNYIIARDSQKQKGFSGGRYKHNEVYYDCLDISKQFHRVQPYKKLT